MPLVARAKNLYRFRNHLNYSEMVMDGNSNSSSNSIQGIQAQIFSRLSSAGAALMLEPIQARALINTGGRLADPDPAAPPAPAEQAHIAHRLRA